ncbi:MAG: hypothetical protein COA79_06705 [Planctomycetota bacterium]|nr:MAG: hypothetical protein COA79_06705 [Planctomycetota bacterium]
MNNVLKPNKVQSGYYSSYFWILLDGPESKCNFDLLISALPDLLKDCVVISDNDLRLYEDNTAAVSRHISNKSICILDGDLFTIYFKKQDDFEQSLGVIRKCLPDLKEYN